MASSEQDKENSSSEDRVEKIKNEEKEDPTVYYSQGDTKDDFDEEIEFSKPVPPVENTQEEVSLTKAVAYLGFGLAALAIIFILFFIKDLDDRVGGVDSAVNSLEEKIAPLKKEVRDSLGKVNADITSLQAKINDNENRLAVRELKRALVAVQSMNLNNDSKVKAKSTELITSIESLIREFDSADLKAAPLVEQTSLGEVMVEEAPTIELPIVETAPNEPTLAVEEHLEISNSESIAESQSTETEATEENTSSSEADGGENVEGGEDEDDENAEGGEDEDDENAEGGEDEEKEDEEDE